MDLLHFTSWRSKSEKLSHDLQLLGAFMHVSYEYAARTCTFAVNVGHTNIQQHTAEKVDEIGHVGFSTCGQQMQTQRTLTDKKAVIASLTPPHAPPPPTSSPPWPGLLVACCCHKTAVSLLYFRLQNYACMLKDINVITISVRSQGCYTGIPWWCTSLGYGNILIKD